VATKVPHARPLAPREERVVDPGEERPVQGHARVRRPS
jgi:hypothetical protein